MARWKKGESGNPNGRPRSPLAFSEVLRRRLTPSRKKVIVDKLLDLAELGDLRAMEMIVDRLEGRPRQTVSSEIEVSGEIDIANARERLAARIAALAERGAAIEDTGEPE